MNWKILERIATHSEDYLEDSRTNYTPPEVTNLQMWLATNTFILFTSFQMIEANLNKKPKCMPLLCAKSSFHWSWCSLSESGSQHWHQNYLESLLKTPAGPPAEFPSAISHIVEHNWKPIRWLSITSRKRSCSSVPFTQSSLAFDLKFPETPLEDKSRNKTVWRATAELDLDCTDVSVSSNSRILWPCPVYLETQ